MRSSSSILLACAVALVSSRAAAEEPIGPPTGQAAEASTTGAQAPARATRVGGEIGVGSTSSSSGPPSRFLTQRLSALHELTPGLELTIGARATEDLAAPRPPSASSPYTTGADLVVSLTGIVSVDLSSHVSAGVGGLVSPVSSRDVASTMTTSAGSSDTLVRARSSAVGVLAEIAFDSFDEHASHDVDGEVVLGLAATRFGSDQSVIAGPAAGTSAHASLGQARASVTTTLTFYDDTDVGVEGAVYAYDPANPTSVGSFDVSARGSTTSFGTGMPMLPTRWSVQPELVHRFGRLSLRGGYQLASLAVDDAGLSQGATARAQIAFGAAKVYVGGAARHDVLPGAATADTWMAMVGGSVRF